MPMTETENRVTVVKIVRYLHKQLSDLVAIDTLNTEQEHQLKNIAGTVEVLTQLASDVSDRKLCDVLDDFDYGLKETSMGAAGKAALELTKTEAKIQALENEYRDQ
jgi:hypothetical protein